MNKTPEETQTVEERFKEYLDEDGNFYLDPTDLEKIIETVEKSVENWNYQKYQEAKARGHTEGVRSERESIRSVLTGIWSDYMITTDAQAVIDLVTQSLTNKQDVTKD